jgi:hypothetical protein
MSAVDFVTIRLNWAEDGFIRPAPHLLRGAIAGRFPDKPLFHQHGGERVVYRYPQVQYRWDREGPILLGLGEAARFLVAIEWAGMELWLGEQRVRVRDAVCAFRRHEVRPTQQLVRYRFGAPWLPFSQENYQRYRSMGPEDQLAERDRLAVAGLLIALRGCGIDFPDRLYAAFDLHETHPCPYKGNDLLGFRGRLLANVDLPDGFSMGRAVSHGYGWLFRESPQGSCRTSGDERRVAADRID